MRNWRWYSLRDLYTPITCFSLYGIRIPPPLFFLTWYPYSLVFLIWLRCPNIRTSRPFFLLGCCYGLLLTLHCPKGRYFDVTIIIIGRDCFMECARTWAGASARRLMNYSLDLKVICCVFLWNNSMYIVERNCWLGRAVGVFNKCSGLRPSDTLLIRWLGWHCHAHTGKQLSVILYDLSFQSGTAVIPKYVYLYWIKGIFEYFVVMRHGQADIPRSDWPYRVPTKYPYFMQTKEIQHQVTIQVIHILCIDAWCQNPKLR